MKDESVVSVIMKWVFSAVALVFVAILIWQMNSMEKRLIAIDAKVQGFESSLGELENRSFPAGAPVSQDVPDGSSGASAKYLHPEVPNFLGDETLRYRIPETRTGGILTRWYASEPKTFNGLISSDGELNAAVGYYVFKEMLGNQSKADPNKWVKGLAERIEITDDYKEYTIYLKKGVKWHTPKVDWNNRRYDWLKGTHYLTARDIKFTVDLILNPQVEAAHLRNYYQDLESVKVIDDHTVVFRWKVKTYNSLSFTVQFEPMPEFLYGYDEDGRPFPKEIAGLKFNNHWYNNRPIGCGPYEFVSYEPGSLLKLRRFEGYHGQKPPIDEIHYLIYPDQKSNVLKIKSKVQDFGTLSATDYREEIVNGKPGSPFQDGKIHNEIYNETGFSYLGWNQEHPIFRDKKVRWAMSHAFNRPYMRKNIFMNLGLPVTGPFYIESPAYDKSIPEVEYNLKKADDLLTEAGWADTDNDGILDKILDGKKTNFEFSMLSTSGSAEWDAAFAIYKEDLMKIGVKMNMKLVDWAVMQKQLEDKNFDAMSGAWGQPWEPDPYQIWHSSQASVPKSSNHISFRNAEADKIIEELRRTFEPEKRAELYHRFHRLVYEEQPYTFVFSRQRCAVWWDHLRRVMFLPLRPYSFSCPWYVDQDMKN